MKKALRILAVVIIVAAAVWWLAMGANRGWTKTSVPKKTLDPVTGIEGISYENRFVPGVDFLAAGALVSAFLAGASFIFRNNQIKSTTN